MTESHPLDYGQYENWEKPPVRCHRRGQFDDADYERGRRLKPRQVGWLSKRTPILFNGPDTEIRGLLREAGLSENSISEEAIRSLEDEFKYRLKSAGLERNGQVNWNMGSRTRQQAEVLGRIVGAVFEELVTREFIARNPGYFLTNRAITKKVIPPILSSFPPKIFSLPDHMVFVKKGRTATLVGFMEDRKFIPPEEDLKVFEQLERQWSFWWELSQNEQLQRQLRRGIFDTIPSMPTGTMIAPVSEGAIWLATPKDVPVAGNLLPSWVKHFGSSVDRGSIDRLTNSLIVEMFLPNLKLTESTENLGEVSELGLTNGTGNAV